MSERNEFNPLISIIIPVYNGENYIGEAIDSALNQTYKNIEIIVVNDGSKDNTEEICKSYKDKIHYIKKENGGVSSALNTGINNMKGDYFSWLSHDDLYDKDKIKDEVNVLNELEDKMTIISCKYDFVDEYGNYLYENNVDDGMLNENNALKHLFNYTINGCALLINKEYFDIVGLFNENLPTTQDYDMWFRIFRSKSLVFVNKVLVHSRVHENQGSKLHLEEHVKECDRLWINFLESLTKQEKIDLYYSEYNFYEELLLTLKKYVNYPNVFKYLDSKKFELLKQDKAKLESYLMQNFNNKISAQIILKKKVKKRIVFGCFGSWEDRGGLNRVVANIANSLSDKFEIYIITSGNISQGYKVNKKVNIINFDINDLKGDINLKIYNLLMLIDVDIYISLYNCLKRFLELAKYLKEKAIKVVAWNHEYYFLPYANADYQDIISIRNDIFKELDLIIWLTSSSEYIYRQIASNSIVMHNALTINNELEKSDFKDKSVIAVGRFDDIRKCAESFIILAKYLKGSNIKIKLYGEYNLDMKGQITNKKLKELLEEYKLTEDNIEFMGFVKNIEDIYKHAKLNLMLSYHEGFGLTIIEAGSYGIPTIAFDDSGFEDMITNDKNGYLIERNNFEKIADIIKDIYNNSEKFNKLSKEAQLKAQQFSLSNVVNNWEKVLFSIINSDSKFIDELEEKSVINKDLIFKNCVKEYENILKNKVNAKIVVGKDEDVSFLRKCYRKLLPLSLRQKIKSIIYKDKNEKGK